MEPHKIWIEQCGAVAGIGDDFGPQNAIGYLVGEKFLNFLEAARFGFSAERARQLESPFGGGEAWIALELVHGALAGVEGRVEYSPPFGALN